MEKHIFVTGSSLISWKDAILQTINEASKTIDYISQVEVLKQRAHISKDKITKYFVDLDISFVIDTNRNEK